MRKERAKTTCYAECWRYDADEKRVAKVVETTEKASREDNLMKQPNETTLMLECHG